MTYDDMTNGFQSYQHKPANGAETQAAPAYHPAREVGTVYSTTIIDGEIAERSTDVEQGHSGQVNPHHGAGNILATAVHPKGLPVPVILPTTLLTHGGLQAPASFWLAEGVITQNPDGTFSADPAPAQEAPPEQVDPDAMALHPANAIEIQQALQGIEEHGVDSIAAYAIGEATGRMDEGTMLRKFSDVTGIDGSEAKHRVNVLRTIFQAHADHASGIPENDREEFWQWCRTHQRDQLQAAIGQQIHSKSLGGYKTLGQQWLAATPVSLGALQAAGIPTRASQQKAGEVEVFVKGQWTSRAAAARLGYL